MINDVFKKQLTGIVHRCCKTATVYLEEKLQKTNRSFKKPEYWNTCFRVGLTLCSLDISHDTMPDLI